MRPYAWLAIPMLGAVAATAAAAEGDGSAVVWYRASEQCPSGAAFLERLAPTRPVRLAKAGDHIDFVVTLVADEGEVLGRLERQTRSGTVAIRELRDPQCERVADALALSLALAIDPKTTRQEGAEAVASDGTAAPAETESPGIASVQSPRARRDGSDLAVPARVNPAESFPSSIGNESSPARTDVPVPAATPESGERRDLSVGAQAGVISGIADGPIGRAGVFLGFHELLPRFARHVALRVGVVGANGSLETSVGSVRRWVLASRTEGCRFFPIGDAVGISPCIALELGATGGASSRASAVQAATAWLAPGVVLRGELQVGSGVSIDADVGALAPVVRREVYAGDQALYRDEIIAIHAALGASVQLP